MMCHGFGAFWIATRSRKKNSDAALVMSTEEHIAFKEWQVVCQALAAGRQSVLLRKGGIHEGRAGFSFAHEEFFLFPTRFHATAEHVTVPAPVSQPEWQVGEQVCVEHFVVVESARTITDWQELQGYAGQHIYTDRVLRERFDWEGKGMASGSIHVAEVRVYQLAEPWLFPYASRHGGCRSWLTLSETPPRHWREQMSLCPVAVSE